MIQRPESPEERLLRLIRTDKKRPGHGPKSQPESGQKPPGPYLKIKGWALGLVAIKSINRLLLGLFFCLLIYLLLDSVILSRLYKDSGITASRVMPPRSRPVQEQGLGFVNTYEHYAEVIGKRNLFVPSSEVKEKRDVPDVNLIGGLSLLGIVNSQPAQAIIEDKKAQKTYFLYEGQYIGEIKVDKISEGRVTLSYGSEAFDLTL